MPLPLGFSQLSLGISRPRAGASFDRYVNASTGNDSNDGTQLEPWATLNKAITTASAGQSVGLAAGQVYPVTRGTSTGLRIGSYGSGSKPLIDPRQVLSGATWTLHSGNVWTTTVTFRDSTTAGGTGSNTTYFGLWDCRSSNIGSWLTWRVGGADIAANIATVEANPGSWTIHRTGQTQQDPRVSGQAGTAFTIYARLADSVDPNSQNIRIADQSAILTYAASAGNDTTLSGLAFATAWGKDQFGVTSGTPTVADCEVYDFGSHGWVGSGNFTRHYGIGIGRPAMQATPRSRGGGINLFSGTFQGGTRTLTDVTLSGCGEGIYGHGSGSNAIYDLLVINGTLTITNTWTAIQFDAQTSRSAVLVSGLQCNAILALSEIDVFASVDSAYQFLGGGTVSFPAVSTASGSSFTCVRFTGANSSCLVRNTTFTVAKPNGASHRNVLYSRTSNIADPVPTLTLDNVIADGSGTNSQRWVRPSASGVNQAIHLVLTGGTQLGDLCRDATDAGNVTAAFLPVSLTVGAGCKFGWGSRTGPQIESMLTAVGVTYSISHDTTIVDLSGNVVSSPGW